MLSVTHPDTTPADLVALLDAFGRLWPHSLSGPLQLVLVDHAMDEMFLQSLLTRAREWKRRPDNNELALRCITAEIGLLELLLALPEDMRFGTGLWAPIHTQAFLGGLAAPGAAVQGGDDEPEDASAGGLDDLHGPDEAELEPADAG